MPNPQDTNYPSGRQVVQFMNVLNVNDSTAKLLFTIPAGSIITDGRLIPWATPSNMTYCLMSIGVVGGTGTEYLDHYDLKNATSGGSNGAIIDPHILWKNFGAQSSNYGYGSEYRGGVSYGSNAVGVTGQITSSGTAGGAGPWTVIFDVITI
jgi:hypothetical protein